MRTADPEKARRIIDCASQLFAERHFHEVRMDDIAARARVAKGTLYLHFKDKEALYVGLVQESMSRFARRVQDHIDGVSCPSERVRVFIRESVHYLEEFPYVLELMPRAESLRIEGRSEAIGQCRSQLLDLVASILRDLPELKGMDPIDFEIAVLFLTGLIRETLSHLPRPWPHDLAERIMHQYFFGLGAAPIASAAGPDHARSLHPAKEARE